MWPLYWGSQAALTSGLHRAAEGRGDSSLNSVSSAWHTAMPEAAFSQLSPGSKRVSPGAEQSWGPLTAPQGYSAMGNTHRFWQQERPRLPERPKRHETSR